MNESPNSQSDTNMPGDSRIEPVDEARERLLTINDLMFASLFSAALFAMKRIQLDPSRSPGSFQLSTILLNGLVYGLFLAALLKVIRSDNSPTWLSRFRFPGHWILIQAVCYSAVAFANFLPHLLFPEWMNFEASQVNRIVSIVGNLVMLVACTVAAWRLPTIRWRLFFMILATHALISAAIEFPGPRAMQTVSLRLVATREMINLTGFVWLSFNLIRDWLLGIQCDWMHWVGVIGWLTLHVVMFVTIRLMTLYYTWSWQAY